MVGFVILLATTWLILTIQSPLKEIIVAIQPANITLKQGTTCCCCCVTSVVSDSVRPHRRQPSRLPHPWDSPGKNTGVGCHFLLQCMKVKSESEIVQSCLTLTEPMDCSLPGSLVHEIFQARVLEWGAIVFSKRDTDVKNRPLDSVGEGEGGMIWENSN